MIDKNMTIGCPVCPNGQTIYCTKANPCDGCIQYEEAVKGLRAHADQLRAEGKLPPLREYGK